jgi:Na+-driven multidrug efflux pump
MPVFGINQGAQPIIGYNFGAASYSRVRRALKLAIFAATALLCLDFVIVQTVPAVLIRLFSKDEGLVQLGAHGMRVCMAMFPVVGFQVVSANFFQAIGKARTALVLSLLRQVLFLIPMIVLLPRFIGLDGIWGAGPIADVVSTVLTAVALFWQLRALHQEERRAPVAARALDAVDARA